MQAEYLLPKLLAASLALVLVYALLCYVITRRRKRWDMFDLAWSGGFVLTSWAVVAAQPAVRTYMVAAMVSAWAVYRIYRLKRWAGQSGSEKRRLGAFVKQAVLIWVIGLPIITNAGNALSSLRLLFTVGYATWAIGFYVRYKLDSGQSGDVEDKKNKAELLQWWGIGLIAAQTSFGWLGLAGPLLLTYRLQKSVTESKA